MKSSQIVWIVIGAVLATVLVVGGVLVFVAGPNVYRAVAVSAREKAEPQMAAMSFATKLYYAENRKLPEALQDLTQLHPQTNEPYLSVVPLDPWGRAYRLEPLDGAAFRIRCAGPDGLFGTEDDLVWPRTEEQATPVTGR